MSRGETVNKLIEGEWVLSCQARGPEEDPRGSLWMQRHEGMWCSRMKKTGLDGGSWITVATPERKSREEVKKVFVWVIYVFSFGE